MTKTNLFVNRVMTCMMPAMMLTMNAVTVLIVWVGADKINAGGMQVGDLMAFIQYTMQIVMSFLMISMMSIMLPGTVSANVFRRSWRQRWKLQTPQGRRLCPVENWRSRISGCVLPVSGRG